MTKDFASYNLDNSQHKVNTIGDTINSLNSMRIWKKPLHILYITMWEFSKSLRTLHNMPNVLKMITFLASECAKQREPCSRFRKIIYTYLCNSINSCTMRKKSIWCTFHKALLLPTTLTIIIIIVNSENVMYVSCTGFYASRKSAVSWGDCKMPGFNVTMKFNKQ